LSKIPPEQRVSPHRHLREKSRFEHSPGEIPRACTSRRCVHSAPSGCPRLLCTSKRKGSRLTLKIPSFFLQACHKEESRFDQQSEVCLGETVPPQVSFGDFPREIAVFMKRPICCLVKMHLITQRGFVSFHDALARFLWQGGGGTPDKGAPAAPISRWCPMQAGTGL